MTPFVLQVVHQFDDELPPFNPLFSGGLWTWGVDFDGQLGRGLSSGGAAIPQQRGADTDWEWIAASEAFSSFGIKGGKLYSWGNNNNYQLGLGDTAERTTPTQVGSDADWQMVVGGPFHTLAIKGGKLYGWGRNADYNLGLGDTTIRTTPTQIGSDSDWEWIDAGSSSSFGIRDGKLYSWGSNTSGATGQGTDSGSTTTPTQIGSDSDWTMVACGASSTHAIKSGELYGWGLNSDYRLGLGDTTNRTSPTQVGSASTWTFVSHGGSHGLGIREGQLYSWGRNNQGRTGRGTAFGDTTIPSLVFGSLTEWEWVTAGSDHSLGIAGGALFAWGDGDWDLGLGSSTSNRLTPVQVGSDTDWQVVSTSFHTMAIKG